MQVRHELDAGDLRLRDFTYADVDLIDAASTDPMIPLITSVPAVPGKIGACAYVDRQLSRRTSGAGFSFAIARASDDVALGHVGLTYCGDDLGRASVGYWIGPPHRGRGTATRALRTLAAWALAETDIVRLELYVEPANVASVKTAEAAGFEREGLMRAWRVVGEKRRDMFMYARLRPTP